jgi:hypothetical protein
MGRKFTFYSSKTDLLQADTIHTLVPDKSLSELRKGSDFHWIDVCSPSREELNELGEVCYKGEQRKVLHYLFFPILDF